MATTERPRALPRSCADEHGRRIPVTAEEREARRARMLAALDAIAAIPDEPGDEATWPDVLRSIDEGRPHRKLFEGLY